MEIKINLIPPYIKKEREEASRLQAVLNLGAGVLMILVVFFGFLWGIFWVLEINLSVASNYEKNSNNSHQYEEIKKLDAEFEKINSETKDIASIQKDQLYWSNLFLELSGALGGGIEIGELATKNYTVLLSGKAQDRDSLITYKESLEKSRCFSEINLPLSNLVSKTDIAFEIDFKIKEECLKKQ